jgi:hypothetical protein
MGNKGAKQDPTVLTDNQIQLLVSSSGLSRDRVLAIHKEFLVSFFMLVAIIFRFSHYFYKIII